ncbi:CARDB domain-containing protein [Anaeromyxobacter sp. Fw109-5]|uniref:CARDB domain-containing protein n=1 Tax=Anaeromyxobacter sp. (strain Fw109-5) TaxID=404589 RepID=UPI0000ED6FEE|nr:CARDB domain-containing protein [Anaeromyxobacter sp. Fw109-5]ABS27729.1 APHP domain protein [Anaeromyxobacter sp. Fw109-5]
MRARLIGLVLVSSIAACSAEREPPAPPEAKTAGAFPQVQINGFSIDVRGQQPAVPDALQAPEDAPAQVISKRGASSDREARDRPGKWIVQFTGPIREGEKRQVIELGVRLGSYLPEFSFIATMDPAARRRVEALPFIRGVARFKPAYKIQPRLKNPDGSVRIDGTPARLVVRVEGADGLGGTLAAVHRRRGKVLQVGRDVARIELSRADIAALAQLEDVVAIEEARDLVLFNDVSRWTIQTNVPNDTRIWQEGLSGQGQIVGIGDTGLDLDMCYFRDPSGAPIGATHRKVAGYQAFTDDWDSDSGHGSHVAGTVAGDQTPLTGGAAANGMAPGARIFMSDLTPGEDSYVYPPLDLGDLFVVAYWAGARIHTNSWGANSSWYGSFEFTTDRFLWEHKDMLVLFSNGNAGPAPGSVGSPAVAKNVVSVGATWNGPLAEDLAWFSSYGPAADGRIKPTLTAPGVNVVSADSDGLRDSFNCGTRSYSGTSMATPTTAGAAALVREYFLEGFWPSGLRSPADGFAPSAALLKATLINSAQEMTGADVGGPIPSNGQGWGRLNLSNTLRFAGDARFLDVADVTSGGLGTGATWSRSFYSSGDQPLKITLVWTDYPGVDGAPKALVNDLDLTVAGPGGVTYTGNVFADGTSVTGGSPDRLNVEEQVLVPPGQAGIYVVTVSGYNVPQGPQPFAVVVSGGGGIRSNGYIGLDRTRYNAASVVELKVVDKDLNANDALAEEVVVSIRSGTEPGGEPVTLVETGPNTSIFLGSIPTAPGPVVSSNGALEVGPDETITATYLDANDGTGAPATATATATVDLAQPTISGLGAVGIDQSSATISWTTDEPAAGRVLHGDTTALGGVAEAAWLSMRHDVVLGNLRENTTYYFAVEATDEAGNTVRDDQGGALHSFTTRLLPPTLSAQSSVGSDTYAAGATIFGSAADPSGIGSVTINGQPVPHRASDGYFELAVPLAIGANAFTVVATDTLGQAISRTVSVTRLELPNLALTALSMPTPAGIGMHSRVTTTLCNLGPGPAPFSGAIAWYLSPDAVITPGVDREFGPRVVYGDPLAPGECFTFPWDMFVPRDLTLVGGTYHVGAFIDLGEEVQEADESDNALAGNPVTFAGPDLAMTSVSAPGTVGLYDAFTVDASVTNTGIGASPLFAVGYYLSADDVITRADARITEYTTALSGGASASTSLSLTIPYGLPPGTYRLGAIADAWEGIAEPDELDNVLLGNLVTVVAGADLAVSAVSSPPSAAVGGTLAVTNTVAAAPSGYASGATSVSLYLSTDPIITPSDVPLSSRTVPSLASGASSTALTVVTIPAVASGTYYVGAIVDVSGQVVETDEANNALAGNAVTIGGLNLAMSSVNGPTAGIVGGAIVIDESVTATGAGAATTGFNVGIFLSTDAVITPSDTLLAYRWVPGLAPGQSSPSSTTTTIPLGLPPGTYFVGAIADDFPVAAYEEATDSYYTVQDLVPEADASDNALAGNTIVVTGPDLSITALTVPSTAIAGSSVTVQNTVAATGAHAGGFSVSFYLSTDPVITTADTYVGGRWVASLAPGAATAASTVAYLPLELPAGPYYFGALVDPAGQVPESDETNNARGAGVVTVSAPRRPPPGE